MCSLKCLSVVLVLFITESLAKVAPPYITPCKDFTEQCLTKTVQDVLPKFVKGYPDLDLESLDPLEQKVNKMELPGGLKVELHDGAVTGFRKCLVESAKYEIEKDSAELNLLCNLTIRGKYKAVGKILIVSLNGDGDAKIKATDVRIKAKIHFKDEVRDGVTYYTVDKYDVTHSYDGVVRYQMTNLFKGNPEISQAVLVFMNENWRKLSEELGDPIVKELIEQVFGIVKKFFKAVPKNELF